MIKKKKRVIISNMAWIDKSSLSDIEIFQYKKLLRIQPKTMDEDGAQSIEMFRETPEYFGIPRHYFRKTHDLNFFDVTYDICAGRRLPKNTNHIKLREEDQKIFVDEMVNVLTIGNWGCGNGEGYTGFGKSVVGIAIAEALAVNTLILVHNIEIRDVWFEAIKQFYPSASIGIVQGSECDYKKDFVIAMCQSLMTDKGKYPQELYRSFGLVFVDEVHHFGSRAFGTVAPKFNCKYIFGLSGTIRRSDGAEDVFKWVIGDVVVRSEETNRIMPLIMFRSTPVQVPFETETYKDIFGQIKTRRIMTTISSWKRPDLLRFLSGHKERQLMIARDIVSVLKQGRNPILVSERRNGLYAIQKMIDKLVEKDSFWDNKPKPTHGFYIGKLKDGTITDRAMLDEAAKKTIIYATLQKAKEGVNIQRLDTLCLVTPNADTEQVCGRICRPIVKEIDGRMVNQDRRQPVVLDYVDCEIPATKSTFQKRLDLYSRLGWEIKDRHKIHFGD